MSITDTPIGAPSNTAWKRASLVQRACSALTLAANAADPMRCCSVRVLACSASA